MGSWWNRDWFRLLVTVGCLCGPLSLLVGSERDEANRLSAKYKAKTEAVLEDGSRCDLLSATHAWEIDKAENWAEGVGQTMHYALWTKKQPGLILLTDNPGRDWRLLVRAAEVCGRYHIDFRVEVISKEEKE